MRCLVEHVCNSRKMKNVTLFLTFCWILWFSQIFAISTMFGGLPDIPANPAVITLGDKTPELIIENSLNDEEDEIEFLSSADGSINQTDDDPSKAENKHQHVITNDFVILPEMKSTKKEVILPQEIPPDETLPKINDSGGTYTSDNDINEQQTNLEDLSTLDIPGTTDPSATTSTPEVNLTVEENPIPVFSEWAQKQMEEAEKKLEKQVVNSSAMKKNTIAGNKPQLLKLRAKNYASPDCGAKIIASNSEAQNTGAVLTSSKDEYMLSPCTNRIWFVVELCEAIQAEKIDLANFELFSSSPKNFSVAVSNRFPTREWSNVGRFIADDQRNIQSFELHPHLFGKFVRVDIHSHYNSEHFCPISLFRVYGTSEFEAFETENRLPADDIDDFDDEETVEQQSNSLKNENNLFKSASDAVMSIVKKAAEVLVKTNTNKTDGNMRLNWNETAKLLVDYGTCITLKNAFRCEKCGGEFVNRINNLLSCKYNLLIRLLSIELLRNDIITSQVCANRFSLDTSNLDIDSLSCKQHQSIIDYQKHISAIDEKKSYYLSLFPLEHIAALCHILTSNNDTKRNSTFKSADSDTALNLTIDQKTGNQFLNIDEIDERHARKVKKDKLPKLSVASKEKNRLEQDAKKVETNVVQENKDSVTLEDFNDIKTDEEKPANTLDNESENLSEQQQKTQPSAMEKPSDKLKESQEDLKVPVAPNVNIFNLVHDEDEEEEEDDQVISPETSTPPSDESISDGNSDVVVTELPPIKLEEPIKLKDPEVESATWENIDKMLGETVTGDNLNSGNTDEYQAVPHIPQRVHSESVFLRLSNRIKALERNMSLSGQYLEELSRRYKKQVEELQHSFAKTLGSIEEQNRRAVEREQFLAAQNKNLKENLEFLSDQLHKWVTITICFALFISIQAFLLWIRNKRNTEHILKHFEDSSLVRRRRTNAVRKVIRRKSVEGVSGHPSPSHKIRRPSEEAMRITGSYKNLMICDDYDGFENEINDETKDTIGDIGKKKPKQKHRKTSSLNGRCNISPDIKLRSFDRQESAPGDYIRLTSAAPPTVADVNKTLATQDNDKLMLEEDYETYIPGTDLAYNEFMPDGPSGNKVLNGKLPTAGAVNLINPSKPPTSKSKSSKVRRLSSPSFLKSPFTRTSSKKSPHSPTGWEWYLKKSEIKTNGSNEPIKQQKNQMKKSKSESPDIALKLNGNYSPPSPPNSSVSDIIILHHSPYNAKGSEDSIRSASETSTTTGSLLSNDYERIGCLY